MGYLPGVFGGRGIGSGGRPSEIFQEIAAAFVVPEYRPQFCDRHVLAEVPAVVAVHHDSVRICSNFGGSAQISKARRCQSWLSQTLSACPASASFPYNHPYTVADFGVLPSYFDVIVLPCSLLSFYIVGIFARGT